MAFRVTSYTGGILKLDAEASDVGPAPADSTIDTNALSAQFMAKCIIPYSPSSHPVLHGAAIVLDNGVPSATTTTDIRLCSRLIEYARRQLEGQFQHALLSPAVTRDCRLSPVKLPVTVLCAPHVDCLEVVDAAVRMLAHSIQLDMIILDPADFSDGDHGVFGPELAGALRQFYHPEQPGARATSDLRCVKAIMQAGASSHAPSRGRLLYLRDFGTFRHALPNSLLHAIHEACSCEPRAIVVAGIVPVLKSRASDDSDRTLRDKSAECEEFLREMKGDTFPDFLKRHYRTYPNFVGQFQSMEDLFSAAFADHYQDGVVRSSQVADAKRTRPQLPQPFEILGLSYAADRHPAEPQTPPVVAVRYADLNIELSGVVRVGLAAGAEIPAKIQDMSSKSRRRRFIGANIRLLNIALRKLGKSLQGPKSETEWMLLLEGGADPTMLDDLSSRIYSQRQRKGIAEALAPRASISDLSEALRVFSHAENAWQLAVGISISKQPFDAVVAQVSAEGSLSRHERALLGCIVDPATIRTQFEDICMDESVQRTLKALVGLPLTNPRAFESGILATEFGAGVLLYGPPGTGKTMVCRALAKQSGVRMLQIQASTIQRSAVGESEQIVTAIFALARKLGPCIIFIDELDAFFSRQTAHTPVWHRSLITEILQEMDGLRTADLNREKGVIVVAATNRPQDLDDAVVRRLPRRIFIDLPARKDRERILMRYLETEEYDEGIIVTVAGKTMLYSGSDLRHLVVAAALAAIPQELDQTGQPTSRKITAAHFQQAMNDVLPSCASDMKALESLRSWGGRSRRKAEATR